MEVESTFASSLEQQIVLRGGGSLYACIWLGFNLKHKLPKKLFRFTKAPAMLAVRASSPPIVVFSEGAAGSKCIEAFYIGRFRGIAFQGVEVV